MHNFDDLAPRGKRFKLNEIAPRKSSAEKWSASHTCSSSRAGIFTSVSSQLNKDSFLWGIQNGRIIIQNQKEK